MGVDPKVQKMVDEYFWLSTQNHIHFYNKVTVGFKNINEGYVVGLCTYGGLFREIDVDINYWNHSTSTSKMTLLFHELTHCYCGRPHDYGRHLKYPESAATKLIKLIEWKIAGGPRPGYRKDGCPISIMHPVVLSDGCMMEHYAEYTKEMFLRCDPW